MAGRVLYLRNVPAEVYDRIKRGARAAGLSMNRFALDLLRRRLAEEGGNLFAEAAIAALRENDERHRREGYVPPTRGEVVGWIREGRDAED